MNKKVFKVSIVMLFLGFIFLFSGIQMGGLEFVKRTNIDRIHSLNQIEKFSKNLEKISTVQAELYSSNFEIRKSENGKNYIEYFAEDEKDYIIKSEEGRLSIKENKKEDFFGSQVGININFAKDFLINGEITNKTCALYLSEESLEEINVSNFSGNFEIADISSKNIDVNLKSGNCKLENVKSDDIYLVDFAGNIDIKNINNLNHIKLENKAGNIKLENAKAKLCEVEQNAGNVKFTNVEILNMLKIENNVGNIKCSLIYDSSKNYDVSLNSESGNTSMDKDFYRNTNGNDTVIIDLKSNVGNIKLEKY
ncbi:DUF4097 family beta strand repeat-containing protein [uncultured Parvimonas sp.]|uniref:DUF4097 family beta strand repeat-containing protein n=1 Tax=uncultured Parvimonas sp. TaxID=747372 RepID=UPI002596729F|nr:DUF4097 family beta strand repeat-containing protein [uncultured Parvimonas sp.]